MTINVSVKPRQDNLFDIWVGDEGDHFVNSNQGYANVEDAERIARRLFSADSRIAAALEFISGYGDVGNIVGTIAEILQGPDFVEPVELTVTYRDGTTRTERLR